MEVITGVEIDPAKAVQDTTLLVDFLQGDMALFSKYLKDIDLEKVKLAIDYLITNDSLSDSEKTALLTNSWRIYYKTKPPTPSEFLTEKYLGRMAENIYPRIKKCFLEYFDETKPYRNAVLYPMIGWGKSTMAVLINLYIITHLTLMRDPKKYFGLAPSSVLAFILASYNLTKASEVLLQPFMNILEVSDFFEKVRTREDMIKIEKKYQKEEEHERIFWTTASIKGTSAIQFSGNLNIKLVSSVHNLLGLTIVCGTMTELAFFREAGRSDDYILRFFNDMKRRIESRMKGNYFGRSILDSSPNDLESPIDRYCMFDADKDPTNYVVKGSRWDWCPEDFKNLNDKFPVFLGGNGKPPAILNSPEGYNKSDILMVPKEMYQLFHDELQKSLKDIAGIPQGNLDKIFYDYQKIEDCFIDKLKNVYLAIKADAKMPPFELIWKQVRDDFFVKSGTGYHFYYKPRIPRVFHIDQSVSSDMTCIAFCHVERRPMDTTVKGKIDINLAKDIIYVIDFVIPIHPYGGRINLDAIKEFITDVYTKGQIPIIKGSFDTYQSEAGIQFLERVGIEMEHLSVDTSLDPYIFLAQLIEQGNLKIGRNIYFKNNLQSLRIIQKGKKNELRVDHTSGDTVSPSGADTNWESSLLGIHAKDISDAVAGSVYNAKKYLATDGSSLIQSWDADQIIMTPEIVKKRTNSLIKELGFTM